MMMAEQTDILAGFPVIEALKGLVAVLGLLAGVFFAICAMAVAAVVMPIAAFVALFAKDRGERRQGWRPVPA